MNYVRDIQSFFVIFLSITTPVNLMAIFYKFPMSNVSNSKFSFYIFAVMGLLAFMFCRVHIAMHFLKSFSFLSNFYMAALAVASILSISMIYSPVFFLFVPLPFIWLFLIGSETNNKKLL